MTNQQPDEYPAAATFEITTISIYTAEGVRVDYNLDPLTQLLETPQERQALASLLQKAIHKGLSKDKT